MHLDNFTKIHRGVDFTNQRASGGLVLNWASTSDTTALYQIEGGDICFLHKKAGDTAARFVNLEEFVIALAAVPGTYALLDSITYADKIYICYQGSEESESTLFPNEDLFVKLSNLYLTLELKDIDATQYAAITVGDNLIVDESTGKLGTSSMSTAPFNVAPVALLPQPGDSATASTGTKDIVVAKSTDTDTSGNTVYLVTVVIG